MRNMVTALSFVGCLTLGVVTGGTKNRQAVHKINDPTTAVSVNSAEAQECLTAQPGAFYFCHNGRKKDEQACARYNTQICGVRFTGCEKIGRSWLCVSDPSKPPLTVSEN